MPMKTDGPAQGNMYRDQCTEHKPTYVQSKQRYMYRAIRTEHSDVCKEHKIIYVQSIKRYMYRAYSDICTEHTPTYLQSIRRDMYRAENETTTNTQINIQKPCGSNAKQSLPSQIPMRNALPKRNTANAQIADYHAATHAAALQKKAFQSRFQCEKRFAREPQEPRADQGQFLKNPARIRNWRFLIKV